MGFYMKKSLLRTRFTLVELLCVCAILIFLMGIGIGVYSVANRKMGESKCRAMIAKMCIALENYRAKHGYYIQQPYAGGFYIDNYGDASSKPNLNAEIDIPDNQLGSKTVSGSTFTTSRGYWKDPFGNAFGYRCPGKFNPTSFDLHSPGPDQTGFIRNRQTDGVNQDSISANSDDVSNWTN